MADNEKTLSSVEVSKITGIAVSSNGQVYIVYGDQSQIVYGVLNGESSWTLQTVVESSAENLGQLVEFALGDDDRPHLTYFVVNGTSPLTGEIVYATTGR